MTSFLKRVVNHRSMPVVRHRHSSPKKIRILAVLVIMCLLIVSLPSSSGSTHGPANGQVSFANQIYRDVTENLATFGSWVSRNIRSEAHSGSAYKPVVAYFNTPMFIDAPTNLSVTGVQSNAVSLSWMPPAGSVDHYTIERTTNIVSTFQFLANVSGAITIYNDNSATNLHSYLYRVRAVSSTGAVSVPSNIAMGTAIAFEFANLQGQEIRKQHFYDVRAAVNAVRSAANLSLASWAPRTDLTNLEVKTDDVQQIRTALDAALTALGIPVNAYEDSTLMSGTLIKAIHLEQLQTRSTRGSSNTSGTLESDSSTARLDPMNQTGGGNENPLSRNFNWTLPVLSLPGRAGMDLGLTLSYNSLVWTRIGSNGIAFDEDNGFPGPGFRLGFPVIQPLYANTQSGRDAFLLISTDGSHTELRQVGSLPLYESADSSHLLLDSTTMILRSTDGTQLSYVLQGGEYKCTQIKDRNGNYITVGYTTAGQISTVTDTLGRVINFNYDGSGWLASITQQWDASPAPPHYWARFEYADLTIHINFPGKTVYGPQENNFIKTLTRVKLADDSHFDFSYTSWGQVYKVNSYAPDNHLLNYRFYNLPQTATTAHDDCPRFTERHDWAQYWNGDTEGTPATSEEALTQFAIPASATWTMPGESSPVSGMRAQVTSPDGTSNKLYFLGTFGWQRGLVALVDTYSSGGSTPVRRSKTTWTQDAAEASYIVNPRVTETNIYDDANNRARTAITYQQFDLGNGMSCHLPQVLREYAADGSSILRSTKTVYNMATAYTSRRILGLLSEQYLYEGDVNVGPLKSKVGVFYDESGSLLGNDAPVQHESANYSSSFLVGRGNASSAKRYDVNSPSQFTSVSTTYNTAGGMLSSTDAAAHTITVSYADSFSDNVPRNTLAYPTKITDADNYYSTTVYNFNFGGITKTKTPPPNVTGTQDPQAGPEQTITYDDLGRIERTTNLVNNAYTRFEYPASQIRVDTYATIQEGQGEAHSFKITDGLGRLVATATDHPGITGVFDGQKTIYDLMGRVFKTSNPAETHASGAPGQWDTTADDAALGWLYTEQTYDWKGRPLRTTHPDTTYMEATYSGCGCAGGQVVTLTDEGTMDGQVFKRRQKKMYADVLGRNIKTETLNWAGGSIYSANVTSYNARNQVEEIRQYDGPEGSGTVQTTTLGYDGFGRLTSKHLPQQNTGTSIAFAYNSDDTVSTITDARGAISTYGYSNRHQVTSISYSAPAGITSAASVTFAYDAAANRTSMTDGLGSRSYNYDQLSRLMSETRVFTNVGTFTLAYDYNLAGQLKKITDASNTTINYSYDVVGRLTGVTGSDTLVGGVSTYATGFQYRAWGALKQVALGTHTSSFTYNSRLQPANFSISGGVVNQGYEYYGDGHLSFVHNTTDNNFDRAFSYDHVSRLTVAVSGGAARNDAGAVPMSETFSHDAFDNITSRETDTWGENFSDGATYINSRRSDFSYDANGNVTTIDARNYTYDASGMNTILTGERWTPNGYVPTTTTAGFDGDGKRVREQPSSSSASIRYYLRSSVLGGAIIEELNNTGQKQIGYVYTPSGDALATQVPAVGQVKVKQVSPIGQSEYEFFVGSSTGPDARREFDPLGANVRLVAALPLHSGRTGDIASLDQSMALRFGALENPGAGCYMDGVEVPCSMAFRLLGQGAAEQCPDNDCGPRARYVITDEGKRIPFLTEPFIATVGGESGFYIPGWIGVSPQAQADAAAQLRALAMSGALGWSIDSASSFAPASVNWGALESSLKTCITENWPMFEMTSFKPTTAPDLNAKDHDQYNGVVGLRDVQSGATFTVTNDPTPHKEVRDDIISHQSRGSTDPSHPFWNYAYPAGDLKHDRPGEKRFPNLFALFDMTFVRVQIHELGASLTPIRNMYHPAMWPNRLPDDNLDPQHDDDGPTLENCVGREYYKQMGLKPVKWPS